MTAMHFHECSVELEWKLSYIDPALPQKEQKAPPKKIGKCSVFWLSFLVHVRSVACLPGL